MKKYQKYLKQYLYYFIWNVNISSIWKISMSIKYIKINFITHRYPTNIRLANSIFRRLSRRPKRFRSRLRRCSPPCRWAERRNLILGRSSRQSSTISYFRIDCSATDRCPVCEWCCPSGELLDWHIWKVKYRLDKKSIQ